MYIRPNSRFSKAFARRDVYQANAVRSSTPSKIVQCYGVITQYSTVDDHINKSRVFGETVQLATVRTRSESVAYVNTF